MNYLRILFPILIVHGAQRWKRPKKLKYPTEIEEIELNQQRWLGDDVFYPKALLKILASEGKDVSGVRSGTGALPGKRGKGL